MLCSEKLTPRVRLFSLPPATLAFSRILRCHGEGARPCAPKKRPKPTMSEQQEEITVTDSHAYTIKGKHLEKDGIEGKT